MLSHKNFLTALFILFFLSCAIPQHITATPPTYPAHHFGNKTANLEQLELCITQALQQPPGTIHIKVPHFIGCSHAHVNAFLNQNGLSLAKEWEDIIQTENITTENLFKTKQFSPRFLNKISALQKRIIQHCSTAYPFRREDLSFFEHAQAQQSTLMVRSSGSEDSSTMANAGGNESVANVTPTPNAITAAMGEVIASYISKKSLKQRLCCATTLDDVQALLAPPFIPVLIQEMIGESAPSKTTSPHEYIKTIPVSGVMFTTDPENAMPGMTLIQTTFGHNQGVVNSQVPVDSWYISHTNAIRSLIKQKTTRLTPSTNGLIHAQNITPHGQDFSHYPTLTNEQALALKSVAHVIETTYTMPMDIEFVLMPSLNCIYLVQARPIVQQHLQRATLAPAWLAQQPHDTFLTCNVISTGKAQPLIVTQRNALLCTKTLAQALDRVLALSAQEQATIKAVIVNTPPASTSHEATTFRALQIPVLYHQDQRVVQAWRAAQKDLFLLDPQQGLFIPCSQEQAEHLNDFIVPGGITSPLEPTSVAPTSVAPQPQTNILFTYSLFPAVRAFWTDTLSCLSEQAHTSLTDLLSEHDDPIVLSFLITNYLPSKLVTLPSTDLSSYIIDECSCIKKANTILSPLHDYLHHLTTYDLAPFMNPKNFEQHLNFFTKTLLQPSTTLEWNDLLTSSDTHALIKLYVMRCMNLLVERFDNAIKKVIGSQYYTKQQKTTYIHTMVTAYWNLFEIWLSWMPQGVFQQARETFSSNRTPNLTTKTLTQADIKRYLAFFSPHIKNKKFTEADLLPTPSFSVMAAILGAGGRYDQFNPNTMSLEDYFTLTHQNLLSLITILTQRINPIDETVIPEHVTRILTLFSKPLSFQKARYEKCNVEKGYSQFNALLIAVDMNHETCSWTYNIPLRGHSSRFIIHYHKQTEAVELECIFFRDAARKWIFERVCAYLGTVYPALGAQLVAMHTKDNAATIKLALAQDTDVEKLTAIITRAIILLFKESTFITIPNNELLTFEQAQKTLSSECFAEWNHHYALFYHNSLQPGKKDTFTIPSDLQLAQKVYAKQCLQGLFLDKHEIINLMQHHPLFIEAYTTYLAENLPTLDDHTFYTKLFQHLVKHLTESKNNTTFPQLYNATLLLYHYCNLCVDTTPHQLTDISAWLLEVLYMLQNHPEWDSTQFEHEHIECSILSLMMKHKERLAPTTKDTITLLQKIVITSLRNKTLISDMVPPYQALHNYLISHGKKESFAQKITKHAPYFNNQLANSFSFFDYNQEYIGLLQKILCPHKLNA